MITNLERNQHEPKQLFPLKNKTCCNLYKLNIETSHYYLMIYYNINMNVDYLKPEDVDFNRNSLKLMAATKLRCFN